MGLHIALKSELKTDVDISQLVAEIDIGAGRTSSY